VVIVVVNLPVERDRRVIRECQALEAAGYRVTVICPRGEQELRTVPGTEAAIRSFRQPMAGNGVASFFAEFSWSLTAVTWQLLRLLVTDRVAAVQVCNPPDIFWPLALLLRATGRRWVFDHHDLCPELYECKTERPRPAIVAVLRFFERLSMRCATAVISTNESYREVALRRGGCPPEKVTVVRNGPRHDEVGRSGPGTDSSDTPRPGVKRIVYLGVINEQDRVDLAVLAAEELAALRGRAGWELVVAGDGERLADLRQLVEERGLGDLVRFTGWLGADRVDALLAGATIGIQPDPYTDMANLSTMAKTVEYLARGVPVVAADLLETRRSAADAGSYVRDATPEEFAAALDHLLDDEESLAAMRKSALGRFETMLAWEHQAQAYIGLWRRLVPMATAGTLPAKNGTESQTPLGDAAVAPDLDPEAAPLPAG
jgi:glycosyltransferase involved in cell wall biosynthesis